MYPDVTKTMPPATVAPAEPIEPPRAVRPFTVLTSCGTYILDSTITVTSVGISEAPQNNYYLSVYPNPSKSSVTISYYLMNSENVQLDLYNAIGENVVSLFNRKQDIGSHKLIADLKQLGLENGVYFLQLTTPQKKLAYRISLVN